MSPACCEPEPGDEALPGPHGVLEARTTGQTKRAAHLPGLTADLRRQRPERCDPAPGPTFIGVELIGADTGLAPREAAFAREQERIGKVVQRGAQLLDREH